MQLGLGTVQFGIDYGFFNEEGKVKQEKVQSLLKTAYEHGICVLDTAASYGDSEKILGETISEKYPFRVITKIPASKKEIIHKNNVAYIRETFARSLKRLRLKRLAGLLAHDPGDLLKPGGDVIYDFMRSLKNEGCVEKIGISACNGDEIDRLFQYFDFDLVQIPLNVLDQRLLKSGHIAKLAAKGIEIHVRSAFLQGLLLMPPDKINPYFTPVMPLLRRYRAFLREYDLSPVEGALGFIRAQKGPDIVLVGVLNNEQLMENINAFNIKLPSTSEYSNFSITREDIIFPFNWPDNV